jgi:hypothetical protein
MSDPITTPEAIAAHHERLRVLFDTFAQETTAFVRSLVSDSAGCRMGAAFEYHALPHRPNGAPYVVVILDARDRILATLQDIGNAEWRMLPYSIPAPTVRLGTQDTRRALTFAEESAQAITRRAQLSGHDFALPLRAAVWTEAAFKANNAMVNDHCARIRAIEPATA